MVLMMAGDTVLPQQDPGAALSGASCANLMVWVELVAGVPILGMSKPDNADSATAITDRVQ